MINTRKLWDKLKLDKQYTQVIGDKIKKYQIEFEIRYIRSARRGCKKIDYRMAREDWELILTDLEVV